MLSAKDEACRHKPQKRERLNEASYLLSLAAGAQSDQIHDRDRNQYRHSEDELAAGKVRRKECRRVFTKDDADISQRQGLVDPIAPADDKSAAISKGAMSVNIKSAGFWDHRRELGEIVCAQEAVDATESPGEHDRPCRTQLCRYAARIPQDPDTNSRTDANRDAKTDAEDAQQFAA